MEAMAVEIFTMMKTGDLSWRTKRLSGSVTSKGGS